MTSSWCFFFNYTATTNIFSLSLPDALPIFFVVGSDVAMTDSLAYADIVLPAASHFEHRSEEHTSELQSQSNLVCRLLLEKKIRDHNVTCHQCFHSTHRPTYYLTRTLVPRLN